MSIPSEEFTAIHCSTPAVWVIPRFHDCNHIAVFQLHNGFELLWFVAHVECFDADALPLGYWSYPTFRGEEALILFGDCFEALMWFLTHQPPLWRDLRPVSTLKVLRTYILQRHFRCAPSNSAHGGAEQTISLAPCLSNTDALRLISSKTDFIPFPLHIQFKALSISYEKNVTSVLRKQIEETLILGYQYFTSIPPTPKVSPQPDINIFTPLDFMTVSLGINNLVDRHDQLQRGDQKQDLFP